MATYYVSSTASGGGAGTEGDPFTLAECNSAQGNVGAGDTAWVKADGTYTLAANLVLADGTAGNPVQLRAYTSAIGDGGVVTLESGSYYIETNDYNFVEGFRDDDSDDVLVHCAGTSAVVYRCRCTKTGSSHGKAFSSYDYGAVNALVNCYANKTNTSSLQGVVEGFYFIQGCFIRNHASSSHGGAGRPYIAVDNIVVSASSSGVAIGLDASYSRGAVCSRNIIYGYGYGASVQLDDSPSKHIDLSENIIWGCGAYGLYENITLAQLALRRGNAIGNCTSGRSFGFTAHPAEIDPIYLTQDPFVDAANDDFRLNDLPGGGRLLQRAGWSPQDLL